jgi:hypothetical protein
MLVLGSAVAAMMLIAVIVSICSRVDSFTIYFTSYVKYDRQYDRQKIIPVQ